MNIPQRLGKYPITEVLGKGAMGIVYKGFDPVIKRPVAIKTIRKELIEEDEKAETMAGRFRKEAQAAGALNHPGIVSVYEYGEDQQYAYIAMEYVEGNTLREYLARGATFDERDTVSIMSQLLDALDYAHQRTVWHRDVKPANIIIMSNGRIKLADFGIARIESSDRTHASVVMGTPGYIAPEHYLGQPVDHRVDVFSAGVLFYVLLARQAPFRGRPEAIMHDVCYHDPEPPSQLDPQHRWPQYDALVARAIRKSPAERFPSAGAFRAAILAEYARPVSDSISESTIISNVVRPLGVEPSTPSGPKTSVAPGTSLPPPTGWDTPVLGTVEAALAKYVGPVARVLVRRAARNHRDLSSLVAVLLESIDSAEDREAFARAVTGRGAAFLSIQRQGTDRDELTVPAAGSAQGPTLSPEDLERATRLLTTYIGPIAKVVARRAAVAGVSRRDFFAAVVQSLETDAQRERFLREAGVRVN